LIVNKKPDLSLFYGLSQYFLILLVPLDSQEKSWLA